MGGVEASCGKSSFGDAARLSFVLARGVGHCLISMVTRNTSISTAASLTAVCHDFSDKSDPAGNAGFLEDAMQMQFDGALGDAETARDLLVAAALEQDRNDLLLAFGELLFQVCP